MTETTPTKLSPSVLQRVLRFPLTRLVLALTFVAVGGIVGVIVRDLVAMALSLEVGGTGRDLLSMVLVIPAVYLAYRVYVRVIERRPLRELERSGALRELGLGMLIGAGLFSAVIGAIAVLGEYHVIGVSPPAAILPIVAASVFAGYIEEVIARGIIFRIVEDGLGTWAALVISAGLFGAMHHFNPGATWISSLSIALTAGVLLGIAFVVTRRLWLVIGIHFAWNFTQGGIFGVAVSGHEAEGLLRAELGGSELIAGGAFGPEASIFPVVFCVPMIAYLLILARRNGRFVRPMWKRRPEAL